MSKDYLINEDIKSKTVNLVTENGEMISDVDLNKAISIAEEKGLDLIQVAKQKDGVICKLGDYGKMMYKKSKNEHKNKAHKLPLKEIKFNYNISDHDLETKHRHVKKFLQKGHKVKYSLTLKGRYKYMADEAENKFMSNLKDFEELASWKKINFANNIMSTVLSPEK